MSGDMRDELARVMYEAPIDGEQGEWPPQHPDDLAYWLSRADAVIARFPWITEPHDTQQMYITEGINRRLAIRHVTPWTPSTKETP